MWRPNIYQHLFIDISTSVLVVLFTQTKHRTLVIGLLDIAKIEYTKDFSNGFKVLYLERFGEITIRKQRVIKFKEKPQVTEGWINGGFFVANYKFFSFIKGDKTILEKEPLEKATHKKQLYAFMHKGFWKCMDTSRDKKVLEEIYKRNKFN